MLPILRYVDYCPSVKLDLHKTFRLYSDVFVDNTAYYLNNIGLSTEGNNVSQHGTLYYKTRTQSGHKHSFEGTLYKISWYMSDSGSQFSLRLITMLFSQPFWKLNKDCGQPVVSTLVNFFPFISIESSSPHDCFYRFFCKVFY